MAFVYVIYGNENYLIENEYKELLKEVAVEEHDVNVYDADNTNISVVVEDANTIPFISDKKVIVVKNSSFLTSIRTHSKIEHNIDELMKYLSNVNESTVLVFIAPYEKLDERKNVTKKLRDVAAFKQLNKLSEKELNSWVAKNLARYNYKITQGACEELVRRTDSDLLAITNELSKLLLYKEDTKKIELDDVKNLVPRNIEQNVFELTNALMSKDIEKTISVYNDLLESKEEPVMILGMISSKFRELVKTKKLISSGYNNDDIARMLKVAPGRAYYMVKNASEFSFKDVSSYIHQLADIDFKIKTGQMDRFVALETFITRI